MVVKERSAILQSSQKKADQFVKEMANKPFGQSKLREKFKKITFNMNIETFYQIDNIIRERKYNNEDNRSMSAFIQAALEDYLLNNI